LAAEQIRLERRGRSSATSLVAIASEGSGQINESTGLEL
jgi:hypothetical protein